MSVAGRPGGGAAGRGDTPGGGTAGNGSAGNGTPGGGTGGDTAGSGGTDDGVLRRTVGALRPYVVPVAVAVGVAAVCLAVLRSPTDAALAGLVAFAVAVLARAWDRGAEHAWPDAPPLERRGARRDVAAISWSLMGRDGRVSEAAVRRLREDARRRLALCGVHLPDGLGDVERIPPDVRAEARRLLGPAWTVLTARGELLPTLRQAEQCVAALERLVPDTTDDGVLAVPSSRAARPLRRGIDPTTRRHGPDPTGRRPDVTPRPDVPPRSDAMRRVPDHPRPTGRTPA